MQITAKLEEEHLLIMKYIKLLEDVTNLPSKVRHRFLQEYGHEIIEFIQVYADNYHHAKEEDILFKYMSRPGVLNHCNPIDQMLYEHDLGREATANMSKALKNENCSAFTHAADQYTTLLRQHIDKEDHILYPMAEECLGEKEKDELLEAFEAAEKKFNSGRGLDRKYTNKLLHLRLQTSSVLTIAKE